MILGINLSHRKFGLDILRALGIFFVLLIHTDFSFLPDIFRTAIKYITFDGVALFFVLSGYLIGSILIKTVDKKGFNLKELFHFWMNRWLRTIPPYYFVLILLFVVSASFDVGVQTYFLSLKQKLSYFFFLQNFNTAHYGFFPESWSLAIEEWFYLSTPLVLIVCYSIFKIEIKKSFLIMVAIGILGTIFYRMFSYYVIFDGNVNVYVYNWLFHALVLTRLDAIMFGVLGAYVHYFHIRLWEKSKGFYFLLGLFLILVDHIVHLFYYDGGKSFEGWIGTYMCCYSFSVFSLGVLFLLPYMTAIPSENRGFIYRSITFISLISYSLYLLHFSFVSACVMPFLNEILHLDGFLHLIVYWTISVLLSVLMFKYIEKPSMDSRKKIFKK